MPGISRRSLCNSRILSRKSRIFLPFISRREGTGTIVARAWPSLFDLLRDLLGAILQRPAEPALLTFRKGRVAMGWQFPAGSRERRMTISGHDYLRRADTAIWLTIGIIAVGLAGFALLGPFEIDFRSFLIPGSVTALLAAGSWFYRSVRCDE